jgi:nicotinamidase-related amidase
MNAHLPGRTPTIPAQPAPFQLPAPGAFALVIIDMQRDFLEPGGFGESLGNDVARLRPCIAPIQHLLHAFRLHNLPVLHTIEGHRPDLSDCPPSKLQRGRPGSRIGDPASMGRILILGEPGNGIIPELAPAPGERVITKPGKGAFCRTDLEDFLRARGITHLLVTGVTTEVCVQTTLREANDRGFECLLIEDATASYFPEFHQATLDMVRAQGGIVAATATSADVLATLTDAPPIRAGKDATAPTPATA